ncbi:ATP-dependent Clp protease proteolytic subunit [Streptomonospora litoralis]|uniref:ATP-dependent Clp protease proteolytic subunit n=1 Tax=Streptomonospora litoralis TaxID=2498135 RepID=A0A4P6PZS5_9ACTN|nr:ATP-dependent Clp protease proteolytic subunit [Streptomonospora litoralis]QBI52039.1 ATP-dependent Clp protease proteolytic subunit 2 [Streptomonospora litoralis]
MSQYTVPVVVERTPTGERSYDVFSRLLSERIIFLGTAIDDGVANVTMAQLLHLDHENNERDISLYINSPGGSMSALTAIYDTLQYVRADVSTVCMGQAASAAAVLLAAGTPGKRMALGHSRVLLHQPSSEGQGEAADLEIQAAEVLRVRAEIEEILSLHTGQSVERLRADTERDKIFTAHEAREYGLIDNVVSGRRLAASAA